MVDKSAISAKPLLFVCRLNLTLVITMSLIIRGCLLVLYNLKIFDPLYAWPVKLKGNEKRYTEKKIKIIALYYGPFTGILSDAILAPRAF